jgi:hypothetical protein
MPEIASLLIGDPPDLGSALGFSVDGESCHVSGIRHRLGGELKGIRGWGLRGAAGELVDVDGLPTTRVDDDAEPTPTHANGVVAVDHVVVLSPNLQQTIAALETVGLELRRTRDTSNYGGPMRQAFFRMGPVILELVGPPEPMGDTPPRFFGLAFTVANLDETATFFGDRLHAPKDAVQPGRRIATLDKSAGSTVAMAFMSPGDADAG